jgi:colanic acid biosynthesis glycosyl transferase WcaI
MHIQDLEIDAAFAVGYVSNGSFKKFALAIERIVLKRFDRIITISDKMRDKLVEKELDRNRIGIIRNWIEPNLLAYADGGRARQKLGLSQDKFIALYSGHIGKKQNLATVLHAAESLSSRDDIHFVIAGDGPEKSDLQNRFQHLKNIIWLPLQPTEEFLDLLRAADCHLMPQHESAADLVLPSKLGAILATGAPLVVTAHKETELALFLNDSAYCVEPGNADRFANAILAAMNDEPAYEATRLQRASELSATHLLPKFRDDLLKAE